MQLSSTIEWTIFCVFFGIAMLTSLIMAWLGRQFYTNDVVIRRFGIMDFQLAAVPEDIAVIISGIYKLPASQSRSVISALKKQLYIDFIFMLAMYGTIFILCMNLSWKMPTAGSGFFVILAWLQLVALGCDMLENIYLLRSIKPNVVAPGTGSFKFYRCMVIIKWLLALFAVVCGLSGVLYIWLSGHYSASSLRYVFILLAEIVAVIIIGWQLGNKSTEGVNK